MIRSVTIVDADKDNCDEHMVLGYSAEKPENPWEKGWRSWVVSFFAEFVVQIVLPIVIVLVAIWFMSRFFGR